jgi:hypothetical protein
MTTTADARIKKAGFYEPQRNLPQFEPRRGAERRLVLQFAKAYRTKFFSLHRPSANDSIAIAREIPANGYGIADVVAVTWRSRQPGESVKAQAPAEFMARVKPTVRAFEVKLEDWRKALRQASRYRFFAHVPIAVLPADKSGPGLRNLAIFRALGVGLWTYDADTDRIVLHYTPRRSSPHDTRQHFRALRVVAKATKALPVA